MRRTGLLGVGRGRVYGYFVVEGGRLRARVSVDEADSLALVPGGRVRIEVPGRPPEDCLIARLTRDPPFVWADLEVVSRVASRSV